MQAQINVYNTDSTVSLQSDDNVKITIGEEAFQLVNDQSFIHKWDSLYESCHWATPFQAKQFVTMWYNLYSKRFVPVIVSNWQSGNLTGLIFLAHNSKDKKLKGAGGDIAYYQTWLTSDSNNEFIKASLQILISNFPGHVISFIQLPPGTPIRWIEEDPNYRKICTLKTVQRPLVNLKDKGVDKLFKKKEFRENCNRLKRLGEVSYERVKDFEVFSSVIDELTAHYDFRQGATINWTPFLNNPLRKQLLLEMFRQNLLHVTLLKLNNEILASLIATQGRDNWIYGIGLNSHSPFYASHSPGFVCFVKFIQMLVYEGYNTLDLTTGNQSYKSRLANDYDHVYELTVSHKSIVEKTLEVIRNKHLTPKMKKLLEQYKPYFLQTKQKIGIIKNHGTIHYSLHYIRNKKQSVYDFRTNPEHNYSNKDILIKRCNLQDLLCFDQTKSFVSKQEFLRDAMKRFELGEQSFTWVEDGYLLACAWLHGPNRSRKDKRTFIFPEGCVVVHNVYYHPLAKDRLSKFLHTVKLEASRLIDSANIYAAVSDSDAKRSNILVKSTIPPHSG